TPHPVDPRCARIDHPLPQGERVTERAASSRRENGQRVSTMKSVYLPVSSLSLLSDTMSDEPGVISAEICSTVCGGISMRSRAAPAPGGGPWSSAAALTALSFFGAFLSLLEFAAGSRG